MINLDSWQREILETKGSIILCSGRQVGKSTIISIRDGERAVKNPNESILIISSTERQAYEIFMKILNYLEDNYPHMISKGKDRPTKHIIHLKNGSIIRCLPTGRAGTGIRGFTITKLTGEEASFIDEDVWSAVTPMLLTTGGDMDLLGTPHGKKGYFWECYCNKNNHFKVFHVNSEEVIRNREVSKSWTQAQKEGALRHLEQEKSRMSKREYAQEYMGEFVEELSQFFSDELINKTCVLKRTEPRTEHTYFMGCDIARMGEDEGTIEIVDRSDREHLVHVESIVTKKKLTTETEKNIIDADKIWKCKNIYLDAGAGTLGVSVYDHLYDHFDRRKVIAINNRALADNLDRDRNNKFKLLKEDLYNNLLYLMESEKIQLLDDDEVIMSLKSVQYEYLKIAGKGTRLRIFGNYTHIVEGLIRAVWCVKDKHLNIWCR
jgi:hypothetical protein